jgi:hypothetical protein
VVEVPRPGGSYSGILFVAGWKCPPNGDITISFDGGTAVPAASRVPRSDTASTCGNDGRNGYIIQWNYNLLGPGEHRVSIRQGGVEFAASTFEVTTFGVPSMRDAEGEYELPNFPSNGANAIVEWDQGTQSFQITGRTGSVQPPSPSPSPRATPRPTPRPGPVCCRVCTTGKACGNSCISRSFTCHQPPGCACNG